MRLYLIRHGQSENNILTEETFNQRKVDPDLTELGQEQAELLAHYLATSGDGFGITHLYCSAMHRALQTAHPISVMLGIQPQVWLELHEKGGLFLNEEGEIRGYPGMTRALILQTFPDYTLPDDISDVGWYKPEQGMEPETYSQFRALKVLDDLRERADSKDVIALVSHAGFLDVLLKAIFDQLPSEKHAMRYHHQNTAITRIEFIGKRPVLHYLNRVEHLPMEKRSY